MGALFSTCEGRINFCTFWSHYYDLIREDFGNCFSPIFSDPSMPLRLVRIDLTTSTSSSDFRSPPSFCYIAQTAYAPVDISIMHFVAQELQADKITADKELQTFEAVSYKKKALASTKRMISHLL
jgi:hypothetical protein